MFPLLFLKVLLIYFYISFKLPTLFRLDLTVIKICPAFFDVAVSNTFQSQWQNFDGCNLISRKNLPVSTALLFLAVVYCIMQ
jgi:hypothetical protein